jgi:hypothetical protein
MESDPHRTDEGWVYVPASALPDTNTYTDLGNFTVDDETFAVRRRDDDGSLHNDWISGPNDGYGFSVFCGVGPLSRERHSADIREFLSAVDPATGYLSYP